MIFKTSIDKKNCFKIPINGKNEREPKTAKICCQSFINVIIKTEKLHVYNFELNKKS